jgi:uncharacterized protein YodC (DUF2158 family)
MSQSRTAKDAEPVGFSPGDQVRVVGDVALNPVMAVKAAANRKEIVCQWFVGKLLQEAEFHGDSLSLYVPRVRTNS